MANMTRKELLELLQRTNRPIPKELLDPDEKDLVEAKRNKFGNQTSIVDGVKFDSKAERHLHGLLQRFKIPFTFQPKFTLVPGFEYLPGDKVRKMTCKIDFHIHGPWNFLVDVKGVITEPWRYRARLLKLRFLSIKPEDRPRLMVVKTNETEHFAGLLLSGETDQAQFKKYFH